MSLESPLRISPQGAARNARFRAKRGHTEPALEVPLLRRAGDLVGSCSKQRSE